MSRRAAGAAALLAAATWLVGVPAVADDDAVSWSVRARDAGAAVVEVTVRPGGQVTDGVVVRNEGAEELTLAVGASDTRVGDDGALEVADSRTGAGGWLDVPATVVVGPGADVDVPVTVVVPADAPVGEHVAAVVTTSASESGSVTLERRLALRVVVHVSDGADDASGAPVAVLVLVALTSVLALALVLVAVRRSRRRRELSHIST